MCLHIHNCNILLQWFKIVIYYLTNNLWLSVIIVHLSTLAHKSVDSCPVKGPIVTFALFIYDMLLTFSLEVKCIWCKNSN